MTGKRAVLQLDRTFFFTQDQQKQATETIIQLNKLFAQ